MIFWKHYFIAVVSESALAAQSRYSFWTGDVPTAIPDALRNVYDVPPPNRTLSALGSNFSKANLVLYFYAAYNQNKRFNWVVPYIGEVLLISFLRFRPDNLASKSLGAPYVEACFLGETLKASFT